MNPIKSVTMNRGFQRGRETSLAPNYVVLGLLFLFSLGPLLIMLFNSVKSRAEIGENPLGFPRDFAWSNYSRAWDVGNYSTTMVNSTILVVGTVFFVLLLGGMAAYSVAKLD